MRIGSGQLGHWWPTPTATSCVPGSTNCRVNQRLVSELTNRHKKKTAPADISKLIFLTKQITKNKWQQRNEDNEKFAKFLTTEIHQNLNSVRSSATSRAWNPWQFSSGAKLTASETNCNTNASCRCDWDVSWYERMKLNEVYWGDVFVIVNLDVLEDVCCVNDQPIRLQKPGVATNWSQAFAAAQRSR